MKVGLYLNMIDDANLKSKYLKQFIKEITFKNRNPKDTKALDLLDKTPTNPSIILEKGKNIYRSRIIAKENLKDNAAPFYGFDSEKSFVPPVEKTRDLRANYKYIPYLYASNRPYISIAEVRPRLGAIVSIATIIVEDNIKLLDFTNSSKMRIKPESKANLFSDLSFLFSNPVTDDEDAIDYIPTQFIAEYSKNLGYDGIAYKSSVVPEINECENDRYNIVVFNYEKCKAIKSNVVQINRQCYDVSQIDSDVEKLNLKSYIEEQLEKIIN